MCFQNDSEREEGINKANSLAKLVFPEFFYFYSLRFLPAGKPLVSIYFPSA